MGPAIFIIIILGIIMAVIYISKNKNTIPDTPVVTVSPQPPVSVTPVVPSQAPVNYFYYSATQYLNCYQNSGIGTYILRSDDGMIQPGTFACGDDGYQYKIEGIVNGNDFNFEITKRSNTCDTLDC